MRASTTEVLICILRADILSEARRDARAWFGAKGWTDRVFEVKIWTDYDKCQRATGWEKTNREGVNGQTNG